MSDAEWAEEWDVRRFFETLKASGLAGLTHEDGWTLMRTETANTLTSELAAARREDRERQEDRAALLAAAFHMPGESFSLWLADHHVAYMRAHDADYERRAKAAGEKGSSVVEER